MNPNTLSLIRAVPALGLLLLAFPAGAAFIDNLNGTVTDTETGLMWDKCSWNQTWTGSPPANTNTCSGTATIQNWATALGQAVTANTNNHRDYNDWRLPSKNELESLVDITDATSPAIDTTVFPDTPGAGFWTSTTYAPDPAFAWSVIFVSGYVLAYDKGVDFPVRLVRSGQSFDTSDLLGSLITANASPAGGGTVSCAPNPVSSGGTSTCTATANAGYSFANWSEACTGSGNPCGLTNVTSPKSVTANFTLNTYPITATANPPAGGTVSCTPNPVDHGSNSTCTYTLNDGYSFGAWSGDCAGASCELTNVTSAKSVTANFTLNTYPITATANPAKGGTVTCDPNPVLYGESSTCTARPNRGYRFSRWEGDCTGQGACILSNVTAPKSVTARFYVPSSGGGGVPALGMWGLSLLAGLLAGIGGFQRWRGRRVRR